MSEFALSGFLPVHLRERVCPLGSADDAMRDRELVVYWMLHGVRAVENPALDVAHAIAVQLELPLLVYQRLAGGHRHDSDRHHTFILEGARDVAAALAAEGTRHVFHLGADRDTPSPLRALARRAALVLTDDFPVSPFPRWTEALAQSSGCPVWRVDTACVVPMLRVPHAFDRAFASRRAIASDLDTRLGAGIAGLAAARTLTDQGFRVQVFERGRGVGGRAATRRRDGAHFDHGAQYFTARDPVFLRHVNSWVEDGVVASWKGRSVHLDDGREHHPVGGGTRYVRVPGMSALGKHLAVDLAVVTDTGIRSITHSASGWRLHTADGPLDGCFDALVIATAPEQALRLLDADDSLRTPVSGCASRPCWARLVDFVHPLGLDFDGAFVDDGILAWVAWDSDKPGRPTGERWVQHATPQLSAPREESPAEAVVEQMLDTFLHTVVGGTAQVSQAAAHRWRFARVAEGLGEDCLFDCERIIALCGDWCPGARVKGAFMSGIAAAGRIAGELRAS